MRIDYPTAPLVIGSRAGAAREKADCCYFGFEENGAHIAAAIALLAVLALKITIIRRWHGLGHLLPVLGTLVFVLLAVTWLTSAGDFLSEP